jgi:diguanylate cyclase (GGDEF)-like protein
VPSCTRATFRAGLLWAMGLLLAAYAGGLVLHGLMLGPVAHRWVVLVVDNWLGLAVEWVPAAVCWVAFSRVGLRRPELLLAAMAVTSYALGDTYWTAMAAVNSAVPFPSLGDVAYLGFTVLMMAALAVAVRREVCGFAGSVWLDSAVGSLGAATVLAVVLRPVLDSADRGPVSLATVVAVGYPMLDLALVATVAGIAALRDVRIGERWFLLIVGLLVYAAADVVYALQVTRNAYAVGSGLDLAWPVGLALVALWVDGTAQRDRPARKETRPVSGAMALAVSAVATVAGLGVLLMSSRVSLSILAVTLAGVTLLAAGARSQLAFHLVARMADLRRLDAATDELTGLPNRRALYAGGYARLAEPQCRRQALLMLDLDKFKEVNDSLGHHTGDQLLFQVGARLRNSLREGDLLARLGGDEFAMLLDDAGHDEAVKVAIKLHAALGEPFALEDMTLYSRVSIGIALFPDDTDDGPSLSALLRKADVAMYRAKVSGDGHHAYSGTDDADDAAKLRTVDELRTAMTGGQLVLYYQPKINLANGTVPSVEALVRWDHPTRGLLYPDAFLHVVEVSGLMPTLTRVVLEMALDQAAEWQEQHRTLTIAVNLSASSLVDSGLPQEVFAMLAARGVPPAALQLEITEEFLMADRDRARSILTRLRDGGIQISVDDFGTGYSSLSYLRELPIDELKLDRSFVSPMVDDARAAALVASTIGLAHSLGLRMVAEGVETEVAYTELRRLGCDQGQGYFMCRPVPAAELEHWLGNRPAVEQSRTPLGRSPLVVFGRETLG